MAVVTMLDIVHVQPWASAAWPWTCDTMAD